MISGAGRWAAIGAPTRPCGCSCWRPASIVEIDFTAVRDPFRGGRKARAAGLTFAVARLESVRAQAAFDRFGVTVPDRPDHIFRSVGGGGAGAGRGRQKRHLAS